MNYKTNSQQKRRVTTSLMAAALFSLAMATAQIASALPNYTISNLGTSLSGANSASNSISNRTAAINHGVVTGSSEVLTFLYAIGTIQSLDGRDSAVTGINNAGQVAGYFSVSGDGNNNDYHAFLYANGALRDLGALGVTGKYSESAGAGINNAGQVVGTADIGTNDNDPFNSNNPSFWMYATHRAFLYTNESMLDLGTLGGKDSVGNGINDAGQVVGYSYTTNSDTVAHAFLYTDSTMIDLNTLVVNLTGWELQEACRINDNGQISGVGYYNGETSSFLLTPAPVPEPSTMILLGAGLGGMALWRRRSAKA